MNQHIMIDTETLGNSHDGFILALAAMRFDPYEEPLHFRHKPDSVEYITGRWDTFFRVVDLKRADTTYRIEPPVIKFWADQPESVRKTMFSGTNSHKEIAKDFVRWCRDGFYTEICAWGHGSVYDIPKIEHLLRTELGEETPWKFWNIRDTRTIYDVLPIALEIDPRGLFKGSAIDHHPVFDCFRQVCCVQTAMQHIQKGD